MKHMILQCWTLAANKQQSILPASLNPAVPVWENGMIVGLKYFRCEGRGRLGLVRPCEVVVQLHTPHPSPGVHPSPDSHWHTEDNDPYPTSEAPHPASKWPPDQKSHLGKGPRKTKGYLTWNTRQACVLTLLPLGISVSWTLLEPRVVVMFFFSKSLLSLSFSSYSLLSGFCII